MIFSWIGKHLPAGQTAQACLQVLFAVSKAGQSLDWEFALVQIASCPKLTIEGKTVHLRVKSAKSSSAYD